MSSNSGYATSQAGNKTCFFKCDYSFYHSHSCLKCKFCYRLIPSSPTPLKKLSGYLKGEAEHHESLYQVPVIVSRYCEPFLNETFTRHSMYVINNILTNGGKIIVRTSRSVLPDELYALIETFHEKIMIQFRVAFHNSNSAKIIKKELCPGWSEWNDIANTLTKLECQKGILFDPYIIGLNSQSDIANVVTDMAQIGVNKLIITQLFATPKFRSYLLNTNKEIGLKLQESVGNYFTYDNLHLLSSLLPTIERCFKDNIKVSMCNNKHINQVLGLETNCCLFEKPEFMYEPTGNRINTKVIPGK